MTTGTRSLLFGVHQFLWHPLTVTLAWRRLYGSWPSPRMLACILIHDWGYWGAMDMDDMEGRSHPVFAANLAGLWFGWRYYSEVLLHSRNFAASAGLPPSRLCWADKACVAYDPRWFYLLRARLSGELDEYRIASARTGMLPLEKSDEEWFDWFKQRSLAMAEAVAENERNSYGT